MITVDLLRSEHRVGNQVFPIFVGFLPATELDRIAEAPQFRLNTPHETIAGNISTTPVREWQRPLDSSRVEEISRIFARGDEIMPNAVLLAAHKTDLISLESSGVGNLWSLKVEPTHGAKPLWILDGQHRIAGLSKARRTTPLPFVLLASHGAANPYPDSKFAKIFAQVTTTAEGLHKLHNEWLTYAFELGKYDHTSPDHGPTNRRHQSAMAAATALCHEQHLDSGKTIANPFFNRVAFNPEDVKQNAPSPLVGPAIGGFQSDAVSMEDLFFRSYFNAPLSHHTLLTPKQLARELGRAYEALVACHSHAARSESVLLNEAGTAGAKGHKALQDGFLHGVMRFLAAFGPPLDWEDELEKRAFKATTWDTTKWSGKRTGGEQTINKNLARGIFERLLGGSLSDLFIANQPVDVDLRDYFYGTIGWGFEVQACRTNPKGRKLKFVPGSDPGVDVLAGSSLATLNLTDRRILTVNKKRVTPNVQSVAIVDKARPVDKKWSWAGVKAGMELGPDILHTRPLELIVEITFYNGERKTADIRLDFS